MDKPAPDEGKVNANKIHYCPWNSQSPNFSTSRSNILLGKTDAAFGSDQSFEVTLTDVHPPLNPKKWHKTGTCLRVPKCVILSSLPFWVLYWKSSYFYGPRDVLGSLITSPGGPFGNYYYFEQWNDHDDTTATLESFGINDPRYLDSTFWNQFDPPVSPEDKELYTEAYKNMLSGAGGGSNSLSMGGSAPENRYYQIVGRCNNVYYQYHNQLLASFAAAKAQLEADPYDPIYVTIPNLMNPHIFQKRNGALQKSRQKRGPGRGTKCHRHDAAACYDEPTPVEWGPSYPNTDDQRNKLNISGPNCPWLASVNPGFGTNTLHMYIGHNCIGYGGPSDVFSYQSFPLTPEGIYFGPIFISTYLGAPLPYYAGRRAVWRDYGYDIGFTGPGGATAVYNWYAGTIDAAAEKYKENFWRHRNLGTRLFTYPSSNTIDWSLEKIWNDYQDECPGTQFYFGYETFAEFVQAFAQEDTRWEDCVSGSIIGLKFTDKTVKFPPAAGLREALSFFYPPIRARVDKYFSGIEAGTGEVYQRAIEKNGLGDYNVQYGGAGGMMLDPDSLVEYIRTYFEENKAGR